MQKLTFRQGFYDGIPICLGYLSVAFTFGMMAVGGGLSVGVAVLISMTNLTSAGQFAGTGLLLAGGSLIEIAVTTFVINIRYLLMSLSLSQKVDETFTTGKRLLLSFGITDEIFGVASTHPRINTSYLAGLIVGPYVGWALGTLLGAVAMDLMPPMLQTAFGIAIYGMFIAIIVPQAKSMRPVLVTVLIAIGLSTLFSYLPILQDLSSGWVIIICAVIAAGFSAWRYPIAVEGDLA